jgi:hypothetical protein
LQQHCDEYAHSAERLRWRSGNRIGKDQRNAAQAQDHRLPCGAGHAASLHERRQQRGEQWHGGVEQRGKAGGNVLRGPENQRIGKADHGHAEQQGSAQTTLPGPRQPQPLDDGDQQGGGQQKTQGRTA